MKKAILAAALLLAVAACGLLTGSEECPDILSASERAAMHDSVTGAKAPRGPAASCAPRRPDTDTVAPPPP